MRCAHLSLRRSCLPQSQPQRPLPRGKPASRARGRRLWTRRPCPSVLAHAGSVATQLGRPGGLRRLHPSQSHSGVQTRHGRERYPLLTPAHFRAGIETQAGIASPSARIRDCRRSAVSETLSHRPSSPLQKGLLGPHQQQARAARMQLHRRWVWSVCMQQRPHPPPGPGQEMPRRRGCCKRETYAVRTLVNPGGYAPKAISTRTRLHREQPSGNLLPWGGWRTPSAQEVGSSPRHHRVGSLFTIGRQSSTVP